MLLIPVTRLYWEEFLLVTKKNAEILMRNTADALGEDAKELLKSIRENTIGVYIFDEASSSDVDIESMRCKHLVECNDYPVLVACRNPVVWSSTKGASTNRCVEHTFHKEQNVPEARLANLDSEGFIIYESYVYKKDMTLIGRYDEAKRKIRLFNITCR